MYFLRLFSRRRFRFRHDSLFAFPSNVASKNTDIILPRREPIGIGRHAPQAPPSKKPQTKRRREISRRPLFPPRIANRRQGCSLLCCSTIILPICQQAGRLPPRKPESRRVAQSGSAGSLAMWPLRERALSSGSRTAALSFLPASLSSRRFATNGKRLFRYTRRRAGMAVEFVIVPIGCWLDRLFERIRQCCGETVIAVERFIKSDGDHRLPAMRDRISIVPRFVEFGS